jgi:Ni,Fe-hydrogenase maturation factor
VDDGIELVDGGLQGLNLLPLLEDVERVVFADTLATSDEENREAYRSPTVLQAPFDAGAPLSFDHAGGLAYLLQAAPLVLTSLPQLWVVGAGADAPRHVVPRLARICLQLARGAEHACC